MIRNPLKQQSYNDGVANIYTVDNIAADGDMPKNGLTLKDSLRFKNRTVGINRYYTALQSNAKIVKVIRCQLRENVSSQDVAEIKGKQYQIEQVQYPEDIFPPVMDLSLSRLEADYEIP